MMMVGYDEGGEGLSVPIPLGGPIYVADLVGPVTRVPLFEDCVIQELEVCWLLHIYTVILILFKLMLCYSIFYVKLFRKFPPSCRV